MTEKEINRIVVLVEFKDGKVHQVLTTKEKKELMLGMLVDDNGALTVSAEIEPFQFEFKPIQTL